MESAIDSSFFWGYLVTQIPGGFLASFFPANRIFGAAIVGSAFCNMFIPVAIYLNPLILIVVRVIQGLVEVIVLQNVIYYIKTNRQDALLWCLWFESSYMVCFCVTNRSISYVIQCFCVHKLNICREKLLETEYMNIFNKEKTKNKYFLYPILRTSLELNT